MMKQGGASRLISIDLLKIGAVVTVFFFHCNMHLGIHFGILTNFISQGAIMMDLFFMLSGFAIQRVLEARPCKTEGELKKFYLKRFITIYPLYFAICLFFFAVGTEPLKEKLLRLPVELSLLQSALAPGLFPYSHNGGTWFLSCLMMAYLVAPVFSMLFSRKRTRLAALLFTYLLCGLLPFIVIVYSLPNIYSNLVLRCLQFLGGMLLAGLIKDIPCKNTGIAAGMAVIGVMGVVCGIDAFVRSGYWLGQYVTYSFVTFPLFAAVVYGMVSLEAQLCSFPIFAGIARAGSFCYPIFMAQFFIFNWAHAIIARFPNAFYEHSNWKKLLLACGLCVITTVVLQCAICTPSQKLFAKRKGWK